MFTDIPRKGSMILHLSYNTGGTYRITNITQQKIKVVYVNNKFINPCTHVNRRGSILIYLSWVSVIIL